MYCGYVIPRYEIKKRSGEMTDETDSNVHHKFYPMTEFVSLILIGVF